MIAKHARSRMAALGIVLLLSGCSTSQNVPPTGVSVPTPAQPSSPEPTAPPPGLRDPQPKCDVAPCPCWETGQTGGWVYRSCGDPLPPSPRPPSPTPDR